MKRQITARQAVDSADAYIDGEDRREVVGRYKNPMCLSYLGHEELSVKRAVEEKQCKKH